MNISTIEMFKRQVLIKKIQEIGFKQSKKQRKTPNKRRLRRLIRRHKLNDTLNTFDW